MYKILIVEDEEIIAYDLKLNLELEGYEVFEPCTSGEKSIEIAKSQKPDLVVMDIILKGEMDGINAAAKAIAGLIDEPRRDYIIPSALEPGVAKTVASAVAEASRR